MTGMTPRETMMVTRYEAGEPASRIADDMGVHKETVRRIISFFSNGIVDDGSHRRAMIQGSRELANRINAALGR